MPASDDDTFAYDSDEGYAGPSDDEDEALYGYDGEAEETSPPQLAKFRRDWFSEVGNNLDRRERVAAFQLSTAAHRVLLNSDLLEAVLAPLSTSDLCSVALTCSPMRTIAQSLLFRDITLRTPASAAALHSLFRENPNLAASARDVKLAFGDVAATLAELSSIAPKIARKRAAEDSEPVESFEPDRWEDGELHRQPWLHRILSLKGEDRLRGDLAVYRKRMHLDYALRHSHPDDVLADAELAYSHWPFDSYLAAPDAALSALASLGPAATTLTVCFPASHAFPALLAALPRFEQLRTLNIRSHAGGLMSVDGVPKSVHPPGDRGKGMALKVLSAPPAVVHLRAGGAGIDGSWRSVNRVVLDGVALLSGQEGAVDEDERDLWDLGELEMRKVVVKSSIEPRESPFPQLHLSRESQSLDELRPLSHLPLPLDRHPALILDLFSFAGFSAFGPHALTSLILHDVDGVLPESIAKLVAASGSSLQHLSLVNLNIGLSIPVEPEMDPPPHSLSYRHFIYYFNVGGILRRNLAYEDRFFGDLEAAAHRIPRRDSLLSTNAGYALAGALRACSSLVHLTLTQAPHHSRLSPYPPAIIDALLSHGDAAPLKILKWTIGVPGPSEPDGLLTKAGWSAFADKLAALGRRDAFIGLKSEVKVDLSVPNEEQTAVAV
ncbi:hypothetical protein JCM10207_007622 [Rhodosporidiobolus poonsookiae]